MATEPFNYEINCTHSTPRYQNSKLTLTCNGSGRKGCLVIKSTVNDAPHFRVDEIDELIVALTYWRDVYDND